MEKKAGDVMDRWYAGNRPKYFVPRTNGDRYLSAKAKSELDRMNSELRSHG